RSTRRSPSPRGSSHNDAEPPWSRLVTSQEHEGRRLSITGTWWAGDPVNYAVKQPEGRRFDTKWGELFDRFHKPPSVFAQKEHGNGWAPVLFSGNYRKKANARRAWAIALDTEPAYDEHGNETHPGVSLEKAAELWKPFFGIIHTTYNHMRPVHNGHPVTPRPR